MSASSFTVPQLRARAKKLGISPLPRRKSGLIKALAAVEDSPDRPMQRDSFQSQLKRSCPELINVVTPLEAASSALSTFLSSKLSKTAAHSQSIWAILLSEYTEVHTAYAEVLDSLLRGEVPSADMTDFVEAAPLISYAFAIQEPSLVSVVQALKSKRLAHLSSLLRHTNLHLEFTDRRDSANIEDSLLGGLPEEIQCLIFRMADLETKKAFLCTSSAMRDAEARYRSMQASYGDYTLSVQQKIALDWLLAILSKDRLAIIKAPPSWGKTVLSVSMALEVARDENLLGAIHRTVAIHTTAAMIPFFEETMKRMLRDKFPDTKKSLPQEGKMAILIPSASRAHKDAYIHGIHADILLIAGPQKAENRVGRSRLGLPIAKHPMNSYSVDLVIVDEAHKGNAYWTVEDHRMRNAHAKAVLLSANEIPRSTINYLVVGASTEIPKITFPTASVASDVPGISVEIVDDPTYPWAREMSTQIRCAISFSSAARSADKLLREEAEVPGVPISSLKKVLKWNKGLPVEGRYYIRNFLKLVVYLTAFKEINSKLTGNTVIFLDIPVSGYTRDLLDATTLMKPYSLHSSERLTLWQRYQDAISSKDIVIHKGRKQLAAFMEASRERPSTLVTTYRKSAEGLNFDTIDNIILFSTSEIGRNKVYQAIARAQRVNNPRHRVRVIAHSKPTLFAYSQVAMKIVREDFLEEIATRNLSKCVYFPQNSTMRNYIEELDRSESIPASSPSMLIHYLISLSEGIPSVEELYILYMSSKKLSKTQTNALRELIQQRGLFSTMDVTSLLEMKAKNIPSLEISKEKVKRMLNRSTLSHVIA